MKIKLKPLWTVASYLRYWLHSYCETHLALNTVQGYRVNVENHIIPNIGMLELKKLKPLHIQQLYDKLSTSGLSGTSCKYIHATLHRALRTAVRLELISSNPVDMVDAPRKCHAEIQTLTPKQVKQLLHAAEQSDMYLPVLLALGLGLRRGEVLGLQWQDIDFDHNLLSVRHSASFVHGFHLLSPKSHQSKRTLLLPDEVRAALIDELQRQQGKKNLYQTVCIRPNGNPLYPRYLQDHYKILLHDAGLPDMRFHDLRHTNATLMLREAVPAKIVSSMLGHSSIGLTLDTYSHVYIEMQQPAVLAMNTFLREECIL